MPILVGVIVCFGAYFAGRALARRLFAIPGVRALSRDADTDYFRAPRGRRLAWRLAGPVTAYAACVALAFLGARTAGQSVPTTNVEVVPGGRAAAGGVRSGDRIVAVGGIPADTFDGVQASLAAVGPEHAVELTVRRGDVELPLTVTTNAEGHIGIIARRKVVTVPAAHALGEAAALPVIAGVRAIRSTWTSVAGGEKQELAGPVAIVREVTASGDRPGSGLAFAFILLAFPAATLWPASVIVELLMAPRRRVATTT